MRLALTLGLWWVASSASAQAWDTARASTPSPEASAERLPNGSPHFGAQLEGGAGVLLYGPYAAGRAGGGFVTDFVLDPRITFRLVVAAEYLRLPAPDGHVFAASARFLFGFDAGAATFRVGGEVGPSYLLVRPTGGDVTSGGIGALAEVRAEAVGRALDDRTLEIGLAIHGGLDPAPALFADVIVTWLAP